MNTFKFFQKHIEPSNNVYLTFNMDDVLINVLRYKQHRNVTIIGIDTSFNEVNVPIDGFMRILTWRTIDNVNPTMIEIDYSVVVTNRTSINYTYRMEVRELLRRIEIRYERL